MTILPWVMYLAGTAGVAWFAGSIGYSHGWTRGHSAGYYRGQKDEHLRMIRKMRALGILKRYKESVDTTGPNALS